jgi:hypothetical protein
MGCYYVT